MVQQSSDYFDEDFDENKNCKEEKLMEKLMKEKVNSNMIRCAIVGGLGSDMEKWGQCKKILIQKLNNNCTSRGSFSKGIKEVCNTTFPTDYQYLY